MSRLRLIFALCMALSTCRAAWADFRQAPQPDTLFTATVRATTSQLVWLDSDYGTLALTTTDPVFHFNPLRDTNPPLVPGARVTLPMPVSLAPLLETESVAVAEPPARFSDLLGPVHTAQPPTPLPETPVRPAEMQTDEAAALAALWQAAPEQAMPVQPDRPRLTWQPRTAIPPRLKAVRPLMPQLRRPIAFRPIPRPIPVPRLALRPMSGPTPVAVRPLPTRRRVVRPLPMRRLAIRPLPTSRLVKRPLPMRRLAFRPVRRPVAVVRPLRGVAVRLVPRPTLVRRQPPVMAFRPVPRPITAWKPASLATWRPAPTPSWRPAPTPTWRPAVVAVRPQPTPVPARPQPTPTPVPPPHIIAWSSPKKH